MLTISQIDMVAIQLGNYLEQVSGNGYRQHPVTLRYLEGSSVATDIELLSYLTDMLIGLLHKEHNLVNLLGIRLKLIEAKKALQDDLLLEATGYADELLALMARDLDKLSLDTKEQALNLLTRYKLSRTMSPHVT